MTEYHSNVVNYFCFFCFFFSDVEELHKWHVEKCEAHPCFRRVPDSEVLASDPAVRTMLEDTEESKKVARLGGNKHFAVFERLPDWHDSEHGEKAATATSSNSVADNCKSEERFESHIMQLWK